MQVPLWPSEAHASPSLSVCHSLSLSLYLSLSRFLSPSLPPSVSPAPRIGCSDRINPPDPTGPKGLVVVSVAETSLRCTRSLSLTFSLPLSLPHSPHSVIATCLAEFILSRLSTYAVPSRCIGSGATFFRHAPSPYKQPEPFTPHTRRAVTDALRKQTLECLPESTPFSVWFRRCMEVNGNRGTETCTRRGVLQTKERGRERENACEREKECVCVCAREEGGNWSRSTYLFVLIEQLGELLDQA